MLASEHAATDFMRRSGVGVTHGYAEPVDWIDSAALDLLLMQTTARCFPSGATTHSLPTNDGTGSGAPDCR